MDDVRESQNEQLSVLQGKLAEEERKRRKIVTELRQAKSDVVTRDNQLVRLRSQLSDLHCEKNVKFSAHDIGELFRLSKRLKEIAQGFDKKS